MTALHSPTSATSSLPNCFTLQYYPSFYHIREQNSTIFTHPPLSPHDPSDEKATESQTNPCQYFLTGTPAHRSSLRSTFLVNTEFYKPFAKYDEKHALRVSHVRERRQIGVQALQLDSCFRAKRALVTSHQDSLKTADNRTCPRFKSCHPESRHKNSPPAYAPGLFFRLRITGLEPARSRTRT